MVKPVALAAFLAFLPAVAEAQDFGREWLDRVTHEVQSERGPLSTQPVEWHVVGGVEWYSDDNLFLTEKNEFDDSVIVPFAGATIEYSEPRFMVKADFLGNFKIYDDFEDGDDDEQRLYFVFRQTGNRYSLEIVEILQHLSDPLDVVFIDRAVRTTSTTIPRLAFDLNPLWSVEASANIGVVRYEDAAFARAIDNDNIRTDVTVVYHSPAGIQLMGQAGWQQISYRNSQAKGAPPDAWGYYIRGGARGELAQRLQVEAFVGGTHIESDYYAGTRIEEEDETMDAAVSFRYEAMQTLTFNLDLVRQFTFAGGADPYQVVNRVLFLANFEANAYVSFRARFQYDHADTATGVERDYAHVGGSVTIKPIAYALLDAGVSFRTGETDTGAASMEFDNVIFHAGAALTY